MKSCNICPFVSVISCSIRSSSVIHVVPCIRMPFLFSDWIIFHCIHVIWSLCHWCPHIFSLLLALFISSKCPQIGFLLLTLPWLSLGSDHCGLPQQLPDRALCCHAPHQPSNIITIRVMFLKETIPSCPYWRSYRGLKFRLLGQFKGSKLPDLPM